LLNRESRLEHFTQLYFNLNPIRFELSFGKNIKIKIRGKSFYLFGYIILNNFHFQTDPLPQNQWLVDHPGKTEADFNQQAWHLLKSNLIAGRDAAQMEAEMRNARASMVYF
jgi:hypothetical protein